MVAFYFSRLFKKLLRRISIGACKQMKRLVSLIVVIVFIMTTAMPSSALKRHKVLPKSLEKLQDKLIDQTEEAEDILFNSGAVYEDKEAEAYLNEIGRSIIPPDFTDENVEINFKIIRDPTVNAFACPTGSIYVHTGILARLENEAQLAFLLGHEISHIVNKDSVYFMNSYHNKTVTAKLCDVVFAPASVFFGALVDLIASGFFLFHAATVTGYNREQESRADKEALTNGNRQDYNLTEATRLIEILMAERDRYVNAEEVYFLMSHPHNKARHRAMKRTITKKFSESTGKKLNEERFFKNMVKIKNYNASLNIKMDRLEHAMDNLKTVLDKIPDNAEAHFYTAEVYRNMYSDSDKLKHELNTKTWYKLRRRIKKEKLVDQWREKAFEEYESALQYDPGYYDAYRGLGLLWRDCGERVKALEHLNKYLEFKEDAKDKRYVTSLIKKLENERDEPISKKKRMIR